MESGLALGRITIFGIAAILLAAFPARSSTAANEDNRPTVTWIEIDWEPAWIHDGTLRGTGYAQLPMAMLRERLPGYRHRDRRVNNVRIYSSLRVLEACFPISSYQALDITAEQAKGMIWSAPTFIFFYHGLVARPQAADTIRKYEVDGHVDLPRLMADKDAIGAFQPGRAYSSYLNRTFATNPHTLNLFRWSGRRRLTEGMFRMLDAERFDYFVDYYATLKYHEEATGHKGRHQYFPILGHKGKFGMGAVVCNDTDQGRALMRDINTVLATLRQDPAFIAANRRWLANPGQEEEYNHLWQTELLPRLK